jgi:hypothetical protein
MTNSDFHLSDEQLAAFVRWSRRVVRVQWRADATESVSATIAFTFTSVGRQVEARIGPDSLMLEVLGESTYPVPRETSG